MIIDRMRFTVIEVNTNIILSTDLVVKQPELVLNLSSPAKLSFSIDQGQQSASAFGIEWKNWGQWIIPEIETDQFGKIVLGALLVSENKIDADTGDLQVDCIGFLGYPKGIPWMENYNPIAVDPSEIIQRIFAHLQSFPNANLGIDVLPTSTGTQMLPGYGFDGQILSFDFFAIFIRAVDFTDCGDYMFSLARDLPLDLFEKASWNSDRTEVTKTVQIAYPLGGMQQDNLAFRLGENVINAERAEEMDIEPVSDVIIRSWLPGRTYSSRLSNADMTRARRVVMEEDANINSTERSAAWAHRKLTRRNIPKYFSKIEIDPNHPNAPFGSWGVGDSILVEAENFPWTGDISEWHRIISVTIKQDEPNIELGLKVEGAFNYDPIEYDPDYDSNPTVDPNLLSNGYFTKSLSGWYRKKGSWIRVATSGYTGDGCVRIDCDDDGEELQSEKVFVLHGETFNIQAAVRYQDITVSGTPPWTMAIALKKYKDGGQVDTTEILDTHFHIGTGGYTVLTATWAVPLIDINEISLSLMVNDSVTGGIAFWDDVRILPA
jgi:hypothetical protein